MPIEFENTIKSVVVRKEPGNGEDVVYDTSIVVREEPGVRRGCYIGNHY